MAEKKGPEEFEVTELEDKDLEGVVGGAKGLDIACTDNEECPTNGGNCVAGCGCSQ